MIWTRLAPEPFDAGYLGQTIFEVAWEVADAADFARIVKQGTAWARPHLAHSLRAEVTGLEPGREYFYRFRLGRYESATGRAVTCPAPDARPDSLRFAFASCAHYEQGFFSAYRLMAEDRPDLILHLGDYIYEDAWGDRRVRQYDPLEAATLDDYRRRYTQHRTDPDLQAAHAACPWLVTWDDHEVDNDYVGLTSEHELCGGEAVRSSFPARRAAAYQAWYEHMPVRPSRLQPEMAVRLYGATDWGRLARFHLLDTRQFRSVQVCPEQPTAERCDFARGRKILFGGAGGANFVDPNAPDCKSALADPARTVLGEAQERWLDGALAESAAAWNLLAQNVMMMTVAEGTADSPRHYSDAWAGYPPARERLFAALAKARLRESRGADRRHPFLLGQRPRECLRQAGRRRARHFIGRDQHLRQISGPAAQSRSEVPRRPPQRLRAVRAHNAKRCALTSSRSRTARIRAVRRTSPRPSKSARATRTLTVSMPTDRRARDPAGLLARELRRNLRVRSRVPRHLARAEAGSIRRAVPRAWRAEAGRVPERANVRSSERARVPARPTACRTNGDGVTVGAGGGT